MGKDYTPGPWHISSDGGGVFADANKPSIACVVRYREDKEQRANARLIAAAPDLVEALKALDAFWLQDFEPPHEDPAQQERRLLSKDTLDIWRQARAALAKALGGAA